MFRLATIASAAVLLSATLGAGALQPLTPVHANAQELTLASAQLSKVFSWADGAPGTSTNEYTPPAGGIPSVTETTIDVGALAPALPNAPCSPTITQAKGKLTSGGYLALEGSCFGTSGNVVLSGFPNGDPKPTTEVWTPTAITVQLPTISGVPDLTMHVKVTTGTLSSKTIDANYVAALGNPVALPNKYVVNNVCTLYGACSSAPHAPIGTHWDYSAQTGTDVWTLNVPEHFHLQAINLVHITNAPTKTTTINGNANATTFTIAWSEKQNSSITGTGSETKTTTCSDSLGSLLAAVLTNDVDQPTANCTTSTTGGQPVQIPTYTNIYRVQPMVVGPSGMTP
jgi:hypothetical protein